LSGPPTIILFSTASGGGIASTGELHIARTTVSGNTVRAIAPSNGVSGAGINSNALELVSSTINDNEAVQGGSVGMGNATAVGGGVFTATGRITNSTISRNRALFGGAIMVGTGPVVVSNATIADNSDGIVGPADKIVLRNSILASRDRNCPFDIITSAGYNLIDDGSCGSAPTDLVGVFPGLSPLQDNGGPTATQALQLTSPARNAGSPAAAGADGACETTDQRGVARPQGGRCDIGAFEIELDNTEPTPTPMATPTPTPTVAEPICPGDCDADDTVDVAELLTGVRVLLEQEDLAACASLDRDGNQQVSVNEMVVAINNLLHGCPR
jgi:hypothetical protein